MQLCNKVNTLAFPSACDFKFSGTNSCRPFDAAQNNYYCIRGSCSKHSATEKQPYRDEVLKNYT